MGNCDEIAGCSETAIFAQMDQGNIASVVQPYGSGARARDPHVASLLYDFSLRTD